MTSATSENVYSNYAWSLAYAISSFFALVLLVKIDCVPGKKKRSWKDPLRIGFFVGIALLAMGTGFDNSRTFAGASEGTWPSGVWATHNSTEAEVLIKAGDISKRAYTPMVRGRK